jgi:hypothetical protein
MGQPSFGDLAGTSEIVRDASTPRHHGMVEARALFTPLSSGGAGTKAFSPMVRCRATADALWCYGSMDGPEEPADMFAVPYKNLIVCLSPNILGGCHETCPPSILSVPVFGWFGRRRSFCRLDTLSGICSN